MKLTELDTYKLTDVINFHNDLNPQLFDDDDRLRPEVRQKLLKIAQDFTVFIGIMDIAMVDITLSGSNAAYSYTPYSDIDLHIVVDFGQLSNDDIFRELFDAKKYQYNDQHDIKIKGYEVELYVQDAEQTHTTLGEYSVTRDDWNKIPIKRRANLDDDATRLKYEKLRQLCLMALSVDNLEYTNKMLDTIKRYRKAGLQEGGEFGPENLAFKMIRKQGLFKKLWDRKRKAEDRVLSLETIDETVLEEVQEEFGGSRMVDYAIRKVFAKKPTLFDDHDFDMIYRIGSRLVEDGRIVKGVNTTDDVGVNQIRIEAEKFGFDVTPGGIPPVLRESQEIINEIKMSPQRVQKEINKISTTMTPMVGVEIEFCIPTANPLEKNNPRITKNVSVENVMDYFREYLMDEVDYIKEDYDEWIAKTKKIDKRRTDYSFYAYLKTEHKLKEPTVRDIHNLYADELGWPSLWDEDEATEYGFDTVANYDLDIANKIKTKLERQPPHIKVAVQPKYHSRRDGMTWGLEPDKSIKPNAGHAAFELISPPMMYSDGLNKVQSALTILRSLKAYANDSCGFHINISFKNADNDNIDIIKLLLFMGDQYVISKFNRSYSNFAKSIMERFDSFIARSRQYKPEQFVQIFDTLYKRLKTDMYEQIDKFIFATKKSVSVTPQRGYIEFRAAGGKNYINRWDELMETINRFVYAYAIALDPTAFRREYLTKLYKAIGSLPTTQDKILKAFMEYSTGEIDKSDLIRLISTMQAERNKEKPKTKINEVILTEGQDNLYHATTTSGAIAVLTSGQFKFSAAVGDPDEESLMSRGYEYFMSTSRVKSSIIYRNGKLPVMFNLDGRWINQRYHVKSVAFYANYSSDENAPDETEDRIYSKKPEMSIDPIQEIHLFLNINLGDGTDFRQIIILAKKKNIPIYVYDELDDYLLQNKKKTLSIEEIKDELSHYYSKEYQASSFHESKVKPWLELYHKKDRNQLSKEGLDVAYSLENSNIAYIQRDLEDVKARNPGSKEYKYMVNLVSIMRKNKWKTLSDFVEAMRNKWIPKLQEKNYENQ